MVVNHGRQLVGVISASDVRSLGHNLESAVALFHSTGEFIHQLQRKNQLVRACNLINLVHCVVSSLTS